MKMIKEEGRPIDDNTLSIICNTIEEANQVKVLSVFREGDIIYGIFIRNVYDTMSISSFPRPDISTDIDGYRLRFFELGFLLKSVYKYGSMQVYNWLMHDSDIPFNYEGYKRILDFVSENPPLHMAMLDIIARIISLGQVDDYHESAYGKANDLLFIISEFNKVHDTGVEMEEVEDKESFVRALNMFNSLQQDLSVQDFPKISEKKIDDLNRFFIDFVLDVFILNRI